ncbi:MAG: TIGR04283 family arsenosugar biosynthesis glycosyltransferase [Nitrospirae bacterium]|nr:TIGR04283 family arsenosugar biosynthesis glycosyltransferase [Nitrospirota bacterium]
MKISVIIPVLNEEKVLQKTLQRLKKGADLELIVVDGGSLDSTPAIARAFTRKVFASPPGRARQMNEGARHAEGEILLFLHADSQIAPGGLGRIVPAITGGQALGGAFRLAIDSQNIFLRMIAWFANLRTAITGIPYGDQGIFITRSAFEKMGGFPDIPLMEDVELSKKMKRAGKIVLLKEKIAASPRRWKKEGIFLTTLKNWTLLACYLLGVPAERLAARYRNIR